MDNKYKVGIAVVVVAVSFASGRYLTPEKIRVEVKTVEVEKKSVDIDTHKHKETVIVTNKKPSGETNTTTTIVEDNKTDKDVNIVKNTTTDTIKQTSKQGGTLSISALAGVNVSDPTKGLVYGATINKSIVGPVSIGVWGLSNGTCGASVGISF